MNDSNAILEINSKKLIRNYKLISKFTKKSIAGATIKANAYGIGDIEVLKILFKKGCNHFFVSSLEEAIKIRRKFSKGNIYVLNGLETNDFKIYKKKKIIPILISIEELNLYIKKKLNKKDYKIGIHLDTGMNRLGIQINSLKYNETKNLDIEILISHLASADDLKNDYSKIQNIKFQSSFKFFKNIKYKSLSNSAGMLQSKDFHYDIIRPGISIYGGYGNKNLNRILRINPVLILKAKILQIKTIKKNEYIGYNQTYKTTQKTKIAIIGIGYGDGISRLLSNNGNVYYKNQTFKILGRVSMDSTTIDITKDKNKINIGDYIELINYKNDIEKYAKKYGTISNEILTSINQRVKRIYI